MITEELFQKVYNQFKMHFYQQVFGNFEQREATLTTVETFCMEVIYSLNRPTVNEFASFLHMSSPNAAYKVDSLVKKGYLNKVQSTEDKRKYYLEPTEKYMHYYNISASYVDDVLKRLRGSATKEEYTHFEHALELLDRELSKDFDLGRELR